MKYINNFTISLIFILIIAISCDDTKITDIVIPEENVSYSQHIQPIFNINCTTSCHNSTTRAGDISLVHYGEFINSPFLIIPFAPEESLLVLAIEGGTINPMPPNRQPLTENQIAGIKAWIKEGAEAN